MGEGQSRYGHSAGEGRGACPLRRARCGIRPRSCCGKPGRIPPSVDRLKGGQPDGRVKPGIFGKSLDDDVRCKRQVGQWLEGEN